MAEFKSIKDIVAKYPPTCGSNVSGSAKTACDILAEWAPTGTKTVSKLVCNKLLSEPQKDCDVPLISDAKALTVK